MAFCSAAAPKRAQHAKTRRLYFRMRYDLKRVFQFKRSFAQFSINKSGKITRCQMVCRVPGSSFPINAYIFVMLFQFSICLWVSWYVNIMIQRKKAINVRFYNSAYLPFRAHHYVTGHVTALSPESLVQAVQRIRTSRKKYGVVKIGSPTWQGCTSVVGVSRQ